MNKQAIITRLIKQVAIFILSTGWIIPIGMGIQELFLWLYRIHQSNYHEEIDSGFHVQLSNGLINLGLLWLGLMIAFWAFVAVNRLWPIKGKKNSCLRQKLI